MRVARDAGFPLRIAARIDPVDRTYCQSEIRPLLDSMANVEFLGEIDTKSLFAQEKWIEISSMIIGIKAFFVLNPGYYAVGYRQYERFPYCAECNGA